MVVAVVDTGVDLDHAELMSQIWVNPGEIPGNGIDDDHNGFVDDVRGWDFVGNDNNPDDANGHGTHVAGTIAAAANGVGSTGVAPGATIMPVRVLDSNGSGTAAAVANGIRYAAQNGADIINLSLGGSLSTVIQSAISFAQSLDVLVVVAAGNEYASVPSYPARFSSSMTNVISVGAHNSSNVLASFSNDVGTSGAVQVDAPGVNVYSTYFNGQYATLSGTSMATPHVSGLAALALSANHALSASQLRTLIVNGADRTISGSDSRGGINAALTVALAAAGQTSTSATAATLTQGVLSSQTIGIRRLGILAVASGSHAPAMVGNGSSIEAAPLPASNRSASASTYAAEMATTVDRADACVAESEPSEFNVRWSGTDADDASAQVLGETFAREDAWTWEACRDLEAAGVI